MIILMVIPMPTLTPVSATGGVYSREPGELDWAKAPSWAKFACINGIGGWVWWAARPKWDWIFGWWDGDIMRESALVYVAIYNRSVRKASLHARPGAAP